IERQNPARTTQAIRTLPGVRLAYSRSGIPFLEFTTQTGPCRPVLLLDGFKPGPVPTVPGRTMLDWIVHPDEVGGIEVYNQPARMPPEVMLVAGPEACGAIVIWTREKMGLPKSTVLTPR